MKKLLFILIVFFVVSSCKKMNTQIDIPELDRLIKYGEVETLEISFKDNIFSNKFINKFGLSDREIELVGYWTDNYTVELEQTGMGVEILGIDIYPNRIIRLSLAPKGESAKSFFFSNWRMTGNNFEIKPLIILNETDDTTKIDIKDVIFINSNKYYVIGYIENFKKAFVLRSQWDFSPINGLLDSVPYKFGKDLLRIRMLSDHAMPIIYQRIATDEELMDFLLNPVLTDPKYFLEVVRSHSRFHRIIYERN
jgi:hypothetical protein